MIAMLAGSAVAPKDVVGGEDADAVGLDAGQALHPASGGHDDVGRLEDPLAACPGRAVLAVEGDPNPAGPVEPAPPGHPLDLVLGHQRAQPGPHPLDDRVAPGGDPAVVEADTLVAGQARARRPSRAPGARPRPIRAGPWSGCSRDGGRCRRSCPRRRGRPACQAGRPGTRPRSRRCRHRGRRGRRSRAIRGPWQRASTGCGMRMRGAFVMVPLGEPRTRGEGASEPLGPGDRLGVRRPANLGAAPARALSRRRAAGLRCSTPIAP